VGESGAVYAFEPVPGNADAIRRNALGNGFDWVEVVERAAWSSSGRGTVLVPGDTSWSHLEATGRHPDTQATIEVEQAALDDLVAGGEARPPTVVKIDTEGAEIGVLEGMRAILAEHRPVVICELHGTNERFVALMDELGYRLENLDGTEPVAGGPPDLHALAVPGDRTG
jgi:FkbM family methyltransferase